ncbi:hypothetical protein JZ751_000604, partial [Albula glossodonta]
MSEEAWENLHTPANLYHNSLQISDYIAAQGRPGRVERAVQRRATRERFYRGQERKLHQQFEMYKDQVKKIGEEAQLTQEQKGDTPTCGICHKTKFADGCGHICSYCQTKFCARCGGRVALRSNKVIWVCNLCRKQQEILTKSGAWFYGGPNSQQLGGPEGAWGRRHEEAPQEKRAKLQGPSPNPSDKNRPHGISRQESLKNGSGLRHTGPGDGLDGLDSLLMWDGAMLWETAALLPCLLGHPQLSPVGSFNCREKGIMG